LRKLLLKAGFAPGDGVLLTAAVRDLHQCYPGEFQTDVRTPYPDLWRHNPHLTPLQADDPAVQTLECDYPLIQSANAVPCHALHGFIQFFNDQLGLQITPTAFRGDIHLSAQEQAAPSQVSMLLGGEIPFWLVSAGGKFDLTVKWWEQARWQAVVDHFRDRLLFVQVGNARHYHPRLNGVLDLRGWTSLRQLMRLVYRAQGILSPVTCLMHLAAAVPVPPGQPTLRPCVVVAGGREPAHWEAYPGHQFLHNVGALPCCAQGGCWKKRAVPLGDGSDNDEPQQLCTMPVGSLPRCMDMITPRDVIRAVESYFEGGALTGLSAQEARRGRRAPTLSCGVALDEASVTRRTARLALEQFIPRLPPCPDHFRGRGIVLAASGARYVACAWICLRILRHLGSRLPIELWHRGAPEWDVRLTDLLAPYDVTVVDASAVLKRHPADIGHPFALKPYAILHSAFREALWLDADQVPVQNPDFLFDTPEYRAAGAVFWPDFQRFPPEHPMWRYTGVPYRDEPEIQAGEILVDKVRCWRPLRLSLWFNEHHRFFYRYMIGDKDSYRFAWHKLGESYAMPPFPIHPLEGTMCQHDFSGRRLFQHRNARKWKLHGPNARVAGFQFESECLEFLRELRQALGPAVPDRSRPPQLLHPV
jgi:ADP-heptose:LPS heptosyltransferase